METTDLVQAKELIGAYTATINLYGHAQFAGLGVIGQDALEIRELVFAEMLTLYIQTDDEQVRLYFHRIGIGDRLLDEARVILRGEGSRRLDYLQTLATNLQQVVEGPQVSLLDAIGRAVT
jgi:hypothetical protein